MKQENQNRENRDGEGLREGYPDPAGLQRHRKEDEFRAMGECAVRLLLIRLEMINIELRMKLDRDVIQLKTGRLKSYESICRKLYRKGLSPEQDASWEAVNDLIGVRAICSYTDDIYRVADCLRRQSGIRILCQKDYMKTPKRSGYRSLHLITEVCVEFLGEIQWVKTELQLRTAAMDYWANLDHQLRYKRGGNEMGPIDEELRECAEMVSRLDQRMLAIRQRLEAMQEISANGGNWRSP